MLYTLIADADHYKSAMIDRKAVEAVVGGLRDGRLNDRIDMNHAPRTWAEVYQDPIRITFPTFQRSDEALPIPDISVLEGRLFLNQKAYDVLKPIIEQDGEFLPAYSEETGDGHFFTPLKVVEDVDALENSLIHYSEGGDVDHLAFKEDRLQGWTIFRCKLTVYMRLYCTEEVKSAIEGEGLSGLFISPDLANTFPEESVVGQ